MMSTQVCAKPIDILLVNDDPYDIRFIKESLSDEDQTRFGFKCVGKLTDTIACLEEKEYDIIMLDLSLPDSQGFDTFSSVRMHSPKVPIVLLTGINDEELAVRALQNGAQDYLIKGQINGGELSRSIRFAIERHNANQKEHHMAYYDGLTNLPNRQLFHDRLNQALSHAQRYDQKVALMFIDLDDFKKVNDTMGHDMGDLLLQSVARRLEYCLRKSDTVARLGGDEFTCILPNIEKAEDVKIVAQKIVRALTTPFQLNGQEIQISGSVGASLFPDDTEDSELLIKNADMAMFQAKKQGRNNFKIFSGRKSDNIKIFSSSVNPGNSIVHSAHLKSRKFKLFDLFKSASLF